MYPEPIERPRITVRTDRVNALLGTALATAEIEDLLAPLGIETEGTGRDFIAIAPTFRPDLEREIDIVEEVARRVGLQNIRRTVPANPEKIGALTPAQRERRAIADVLVGAGYDEAYTLPLLAPADLTRAGFATDAVIEVENPLRAEESLLRPALLPGILRAVAFNAAHGTPDVSLFEVGTVFAPPDDGKTLPDETAHLAAVARRPGARARRTNPIAMSTSYDATARRRGARAGAAARGLAARVRADRRGFHPARAAAVLVDGVTGRRRRRDRARGGRRARPARARPSRFELDVDAPARAHASRATYRPGLALPGVGDRPRVRRRRQRAAGDVLRNVARRGRRPARAGRAVRRVPFRRARCRPGEPRVHGLRSARPTARSPTTRSPSCASGCIDAVVAAHGAELRG